MLKLMCLYPSRNLRAIGSRKKLALDMKRSGWFVTRVKRSVKWRDVSRVTERQAEGRRCRASDFPGESLPGADEDRDVSVGPLEYLCSEYR